MSDFIPGDEGMTEPLLNLTALYVVGGQQKATARYKEEWHRHRKGLILRIDPYTGDTNSCVEYCTPPAYCADEDPSILFKAGTMADGHFYVCTPTEVLRYRVPDFTLVDYLTLPAFNDVHHVHPTENGTLLVANTGLDMVLDVTWEGAVLRTWNVLGERPWGRFSRQVDYRKIATTKPHAAHPNFIFTLGREIWVSRFEQRDAVCLTESGRCIEVGQERVHDGIVHEGLVYFTTVDGHVAITDPVQGRVVRLVNLRAASRKNAVLGWCRGLYVLDKNHVLVAFSRIRPTKFVENLVWLKRQLLPGEALENLPTRIALFDLKREVLCWEHNLEEFGMSVIFSIHAH